MKLAAIAVALVTTAAGGAAFDDPLPPTPQLVGASIEGFSNIHAAFERGVASGDLPGAVVAIARNGKIEHLRSYGWQDKGAGRRMQDDAIFRLYSLTKPITAAGAMILVDDGRLKLDAPVSTYLPEFKDQKVLITSTGADGSPVRKLVPAEREMTVLDLLRHTSGLAYAELIEDEEIRAAYADAGAFDAQQPPFVPRHTSADQQVAGLARAPLAHQPGTTWEYGLSSDVLGRVIERVSGRRLGEFLKERLFAPAGMTDTSFQVARSESHRVAQPFEGGNVALIDPFARPQNDAGGSGAFSTAPDYLRLIQMLLNGGEIDGKRILSPASARLMMTDSLGPDMRVRLNPGTALDTHGFSYGLGMGVRVVQEGLPVPGAVGTVMWSGFSGPYFWIDPQARIAGVLMIQAPDKQVQYARQIMQLTYDAMAAD